MLIIGLSKVPELKVNIWNKPYFQTTESNRKWNLYKDTIYKHINKYKVLRINLTKTCKISTGEIIKPHWKY